MSGRWCGRGSGATATEGIRRVTVIFVVLCAAVIAASCRLSDGPQSFVTSRTEDGTDLVFHLQWTESAAEDLTGSMSLAGAEGTEFSSGESGFTGTREGEKVNLRFDEGGFLAGESASGTIEGDTITLRLSSGGGETVRMEAASREEYERRAGELRSQAAAAQRAEDAERQAVQQAAGEAYAEIQAAAEDPNATLSDDVLGSRAQEWVRGAFPEFPLFSFDGLEYATVGTARVSDLSGVRVESYEFEDDPEGGSATVNVELGGEMGVDQRMDDPELGDNTRASVTFSQNMDILLSRQGDDWLVTEIDDGLGSTRLFSLMGREDSLEVDSGVEVSSCGDEYEGGC